MPNLDRAGAVDDEPLDETLGKGEFEYLELLIPRGICIMKFDRQQFVVTIRDEGEYISFVAAILGDDSANSRRSFRCKKEDKSVVAMVGCDLAWIRAFMKRYRMVED